VRNIIPCPPIRVRHIQLGAGLFVDEEFLIGERLTVRRLARATRDNRLAVPAEGSELPCDESMTNLYVSEYAELIMRHDLGPAEIT
jgi:hypothetical protein